MNNNKCMDTDATLSDEALLDLVQQRTVTFFWETAHPQCGLIRDRVSSIGQDQDKDLIAIGGSGFGIMAQIVGVDRGWIARDALVARLLNATDFLLNTAECYHGIFPHYMNGVTGKARSWWMGDAGSDVVETAFLMAGLLAARQYFSGDGAESTLRERINTLWQRAEWNWHTSNGRNVLIWHWSPEHEWGTNHEIHGWDECLIAYILSASSPTHPISPDTYHNGWAINRTFQNGNNYYDITLPLGPEFGGPMFFSHFSFMGLDPRHLKDRYANYWEQMRAHALINYEHCVRNPNKHQGYGPNCWGLTASDGNEGYAAFQPIWDKGVIAPTAAIASMPYVPEQSLRALHHFYGMGTRLWRQYGFVDAFNKEADWFGDDYLAIDQGPIVVMIENYRTGLLWRLFMSCPEVQSGLRALDFESW